MNIKDIATTLAILGSGSLLLTGCGKDKAPATEVPGGEDAPGSAEASCAAADHAADGHCGGADGGIEAAADPAAEGNCGGDEGGDEVEGDGE